MTAARHVRALERIAPGPDDRVLEVGCGHGVTATLVLERLAGAGDLTAIDRSSTMVAAAGARNAAAVAAGRFTVLRHEIGEDGPVPGGPYDLVYGLNVRVLWSPGGALDAALAVLAPGGRLVLHMSGPRGDDEVVVTERGCVSSPRERAQAPGVAASPICTDHNPA